jgi:hypothetical protein|tara:strand:+ start:848 stop:1120 length:273 start_codon:yes stop_codon:yes gene_type:complete
MFWALRKKSRLHGVKIALMKFTEHRSVKHDTVIKIIEHCLILDRDIIITNCKDIDFNPLNDKPLILHILEHFYILDSFPEHKRLIKKILS